VSEVAHAEWRSRWLSRLDPGVAAYVDALRASGVETFESCEGGDGHAYPEPTVRFKGDEAEGFRAVTIMLSHGFPVRAVRQYWAVLDGKPCGPDWEIAFWRAATCLQSSDERTPRTSDGCIPSLIANAQA
jgi:hypothetical protein